MPEVMPESFIGVRCQHMVGGGIMSYKCERQQGHMDWSEPHYARDVESSRRAWKKWKSEQPPPMSEHEHSYRVEGQRVVCEDPRCAHSLAITTINPQAPQAPESVEEAFSQVTGAQHRITQAEATGESPDPFLTPSVTVVPPEYWDEVVSGDADFDDEPLPEERAPLPIRETLEMAIADVLIAEHILPYPSQTDDRLMLADRIMDSIIVTLGGSRVSNS